MAFRFLLPCLCFGLLCGCTKQAPDEDHDRLLDEANEILLSDLSTYSLSIDRRANQYGRSQNAYWENAYLNLNTLYEQTFITGGISPYDEKSPEAQLDSIIYRSTLVQFTSNFVINSIHNLEVNRAFCGEEVSSSEASLLLNLFQHNAFTEMSRGIQSPCFYIPPSKTIFSRHHTILLSSETNYFRDVPRFNHNRDIPVTVMWNNERLPGAEYSLISKTIPFMVEIEIPDDRIEETNFIYVEINLIDPLTNQTFVVNLRSYLEKSDFYDH